MLLGIIFFSILSAFIIHIIFWRLFEAKASLKYLLVIFILTLLGAITILFFLYNLSLYMYLQFGLCYLGIMFFYMIVYSAIEQESPSLTILQLLYSYPHYKKVDLLSFFSKNDPIQKRLQLLQEDDWITQYNDKIYLTKKGLFIAKFFNLTSKIFGIKSGG